MKHTIQIFFFMLSSCIVSLGSVYAQRTYTLDECLQQALANNVRMKNTENNKNIAAQDKKNAFTKYFPSVSATGGGFIASNGLFNFEMSPEMQMSLMKNGVIGGVSASMPIFTGGQIVNGNKLAEVGEEVSRLQYNMSENEVRLTTENYFWQIITLK